jgi:hypothetical protein
VTPVIDTAAFHEETIEECKEDHDPKEEEVLIFHWAQKIPVPVVPYE